MFALGPMSLSAERLCLRDFQISDIDAVHAYAGDPQVTMHQAWGPNGREQTSVFVLDAAREAATPERRSFNLAVALADGTLIGGCYAGLADDGLQAEIGYSFNPNFWGNGYATEAIRRLLGFLFRDLRVHRVFATCGPDNLNSLAVLTRGGFILEGRMRDHKLVRGNWRDSLLLSMLETDAVAIAL